MKTRPILFSAPMVRALLAGTKTQTRRIVKCDHDPKRWNGGQCHILSEGPTAWNVSGRVVICPYGRRGDGLWVRETWNAGLCDDDESYGPYLKIPKTKPYSCWIAYAADGFDDPFRPSIHMPRWASRITLEITAVSVERLADISEADACAEGCAIGVGAGNWRNARHLYNELWESFNGAGSWALNPWVWKIEFKRLSP